jgi:hypothetical protein
MNLDYLKPYNSWTLWLYNKKGLQQITFNNKSCSTKMFSDLFLACKRSIVKVLNLCKKYCGALIYIIKKERKPTSFSNCRYLELIWIIRRKKKKPRFILELSLISNFSNWRHLELLLIHLKFSELLLIHLKFLQLKALFWSILEFW